MILGWVTRLHIVDTTLHADVKSDSPERIVGRYTRGEAITERDGVESWELIRLSVSDYGGDSMFGVAKSLIDIPVCSIRKYGSFEVTMERMESMVKNFEKWKASGYLPPVAEVERPVFDYPEIKVK